jgi:hypothetical protein
MNVGCILLMLLPLFGLILFWLFMFMAPILKFTQ